MEQVKTIADATTANAILGHPLRRQILAAARSPVSATDIARQLGLPRQRINYHVRELARAGLLVSGAQQRKRNMVEQQYVASARSYILPAEILGEAGDVGESDPDPASAAHLAAVCARTQRDVGALMSAASSAGIRVKTLALEEDLYFSSAQQRAEFMEALVEAVQSVIADYDANSASSATRVFRLLLACYPRPE